MSATSTSGPPLALAAGARLGPYEIQSALGAGGMGEVYGAYDPKLKRDIAIKVLPATTARDAERRAGFEREAQSIAALNHPNIVTVYSVEEADGVLFLTMELVEGKPLSDLMMKGGQPLARILSLAIPLADAVSAAHRKGITHRDLKPANVMVTVDGRVKVLDFGLAKLTEPSLGGGSASALPTRPVTSEGLIVGTVAYMSPEQAEGKAVDHRSDVFSLGVILYEMATGERPFRGDTSAAVITSLLRDTPRPITDFNHTLPRDLAVIVRRCLARDPEYRTQTAKDLRNDLEDLKHDVDSGELFAPTAVPQTPPGRSRLRWTTVVVMSALAGAVATWLVMRPSRRAVPGTPTLTYVARLTHDPGLSEWPTWSPDGSLLAFASNRSGSFEIYVRRVEGGQEVNVTNNASQNFQPAFSPDGHSIAFVSTRASRTGMVKLGSTIGTRAKTGAHGGDVWVMPALGGQARRVAQDGNFPVWHPAGRKIAYVSGNENHRSIVEVPADGGTPRPVLASESSMWEISRVGYSPDGSWITFESDEDGEILVVPAAGGQPRKLLKGFSHVWEPSGKHLYYFSGDSKGGMRLQSVAIEEPTAELKAGPETVAWMTGLLHDLAISRDGARVALSEAEDSLNLTRLPLTPAGSSPAGPEDVLSTGHVYEGGPSVSPDGRRIAFRSDRLGHDQVWVLDLDTRGLEALELPGGGSLDQGPHWHPDGRRLVVLRSFPDGKRSLWLIAADASSAEELTSPGDLLNVAEGWPIAPDGRKTLYSARTNGHFQLFSVDLSTRQTRQITFSPDDKNTAAWSPDGRWLVYSSDASGSVQLWRMPAEGGQAQQLTQGDDRIRHMFYSPDGRWLYFQPNHLNIYRMRADGGPMQQVTHFSESGLFIEEPTISPDGRYLVYSRSYGGS